VTVTPFHPIKWRLGALTPGGFVFDADYDYVEGPHRPPLRLARRHDGDVLYFRAYAPGPRGDGSGMGHLVERTLRPVR
jgi:hypothetical protein